MSKNFFKWFSAFIFITSYMTAGLRSVSAQGQETVSLSGWFSVVWGDSRDGQSTPPVYRLTDDSGATTRLELDEALTAPWGGARALNGLRVTVEAVPDVSALSGEAVLRVQAIAPEGEASAQGEAGAQAVTGSKAFITIMCKFKDYSQEPKTQSYFYNMYSASYPGLGHYWKESSYNLADVNGSAAVGWYVLPQNRSYYVYNNQLDFDRAANDCTAAANSYVNFANFYGINLMFNYELDNYAWGGSQYMTLDGVTKSWPMTWEPPWGYEDITVIAHEMGHAFGLPHSSGKYGQTYDNQWDMMSDSWSNCNRATDSTYGCLAQHTISYHKDTLGWIGAGKYTVAYNTQAVLTLEQLALPQTGNYKMIQIPINGTSRFYTVEVRRQTGYDYKLPGQAAIIHEVDPARANEAQVIDPDNNGNTGDAGAQWTVGETFTDAANKITVTIQSATATGFVVYVKNGTPPPGAFNKLSPANAATGISPNPTLSWEASPGALSYEYCYYKSGQTCVWTSNGDSTSKSLTGLLSDTTYAWHVRALGAGGLITYSNGASGASWTFTTVPAPPSAFNKTSPSNGAANQSAQLTLTWGTSANAAHYEYCVKTSPDCGESDWADNGTSASKTFTNELYGGATYYWQARAVNGAGTTYANGSSSAYWIFSTRNLAAISAVSSPAVVGMTAGEMEYVEYQLTETAGGSGTIDSYVARFYTQDGVALGDPQTFYPAAAISPYQTSAIGEWVYLPYDVEQNARALGKYAVEYRLTFYGTSPGGSFSAPATLLVILPPASFSKISPAHLSTNVSTNPTLTWESTLGAAHYEVCWSVSTACGDWRGTYETSMTISGLQPNTSYYWQVRAVSAAGDSTYANGLNKRWLFTTMAGSDPYEIDDTSAQAKPIFSGSPQLRSVNPIGDVDWVKFELTQASSVALETTGITNSDTRMWLYNSALSQIAFNDDKNYSAGNWYSYIYRACGTTALAPGVYYVRVDEYGSDHIIPEYTLTLNATPCAPPEPTNLRVSGTTTSSVTLAWDDNSTNESGFKIYRWGYHPVGGWGFWYHAAVGPNITSYTESGLTCGNDFNYYEVSAYNSYGESARAAFVQGTTDPCPPVALSVTNVSFDPLSPYTNDNVYVGVQVNNASSTAARSFWIDIYLNRAPSGCNDPGDYKAQANGLAGNSSSIWQVKIPASHARAAGGVQIYAYADSGCNLQEDNETDNVAGPYALTYQAPPVAPPAHDDIANARETLPFPYADNVDVRGATQLPSDPAAPSCNLAPGLASVWYRYTPSFNSTLKLDTFGSSYDTYIAVWSGAPESLTPVACNDDYGGGLQSFVQFDVNAGTTYYAQVAQYNGASNVALGQTALPDGTISPRPNLDSGISLAPESEKQIPAEGEAGALAGGSLNFHANFVTYTISGNVGVGGATLNYTDETPKTVTSAANGSYSLQAPKGWSGTVAPSKYAYAFKPANRSYVNLSANQANQNFTASSLIPAAFGKSAPANDSRNVALTPVLIWGVSPLAESYEYCYTDALPCADWRTDAGANTSVQLAGLQTGKTYYWQVRARNTYGVTEADNGAVWSFRTGEPPAPFNKTGPSNGATNQIFAPALTWNASAGATPTERYEYCVNTAPSCPAWQNNGLKTFVDLSGLTPATTYYWQARAINDFGVTEANYGWSSFSTAPLQTASFFSVASQDGWILETSEFSALGGTAAAAGRLRVGDDARNRQYRSILSFNTAPLPDNARLSRVSLRVYKAASTSPDPFAALGNLIADLKTRYFGSGLALAAADFSAPGERLSSKLQLRDAGGGWYELSLNPLYFPYLNLKGATQFRLAFERDDNNNRKADYVQFDSGGETNKPQLIVEYTLP